MKTVFPEEKGKIVINGHQMEWVFRRSKSESAFGIRGSRIFELTLNKDGKKTLEYVRGYYLKPDQEDEETILCLSMLIDKFGKQKERRKE